MFANKIIPIVLAGGLLAGCQDMGTKQTAGGLLGGVGGAVAGAQFGKGQGQVAAAALGALLGAYAGSEVGRSLDRADQLAAYQASQRAFEVAPVGQTVQWQNPDSGHYGSFTPVRTYEAGPGQFCREYQSTVSVGGRLENAYGTACRQPDGSWKITN